MELFFNHAFIRALSFYFTSEDEHNIDSPLTESRLAFKRSVIAIMDSFETNKSVEKITGMIDFIASSEYVHSGHYKDYLLLKDELYTLSDEDLFNLYSAMFNISKYSDISFPANDILNDHFTEIVIDIARNTTISLTFNTEQDVDRFEDEVYRFLCKYVIEHCPLEKICIWGNEYDDGIERDNEVTDGRPYEEYEKLNCYVHVTTQEWLDRVKGATYLAAYKTMDVDYGIMLIGNLITFTNKDLSDSVTFQIIGHKYYDSYKEMFEKLGVKAFGYKEESSEACAESTQLLFSDYYSEGPLALEVEMLQIPILTKEHLIELRKYKNREYYKKAQCQDPLDESNWETYLILDCCNLEVGNWYKYCPRCGKKVDPTKCRKGKTPPYNGLYELFDYATWDCSCGKGLERWSYYYCPICGKNRSADNFEDTLDLSIINEINNRKDNIK